MFEKLKNKSFTASQERFDTLVGRTTTIFGRLVLLDSVRIDGKVMGNIETAPGNKISVAIGPTGEVAGDIHAHRILVAGVSQRLGDQWRHLVWLDRHRARCPVIGHGGSKQSCCPVSQSRSNCH